MTIADSPEQTAQVTEQKLSAHAEQPLVLFDSFHAHNFLDRGLIPGEHTYHRFTGLRRAAGLLTDRQVDVQELIVGPITPGRLDRVQLIVLNLSSMDRPPWLTSEIDAVEQYLRDGGGMIFITDHTNCYYHQYHLLPLWQRLGLIPTFETTCERTRKNLLSHSGPSWLLIRDFEKHPVTDGVRFFGIQTGGRLVGEGVIARTSPNAWADAGVSPLYGEGNPGLTGDLRYSDSEEQGAQGVILAKSIDRGRIVIISDQNALGDALISYGDNWRVWLNACNWAGRLGINTNALTIDQQDARPTGRASDFEASAPTAFDRLVGQEPDRNSHPTLPARSWQVECWEGLSTGDFRWGSGDPDDYYYFWCWLNRWCWASGHEGPSNPAPSGRTLLLAHEVDLNNSGLQRRIEQVLKQNGKVVLLASPVEPPSLPVPTIKSQSSPSSELAPEQRTRLDLQLSKIAIPPELWALPESVKWQSQPLVHCRWQVGGGEIVVLSNAALLQNAHFTPPEISPNASQAKWQRQLYHWLFDQP